MWQGNNDVLPIRMTTVSMWLEVDRSRYSRAEQRAPASPPRVIVTQTPQRSMFRDAAAVAGGVTVGTTMGHLAGEAISSLFGGGRRREEVVRELPQNYQLGSEPSGPCAYEITQFLQCAANRENLQECEAFNDALRECKRRNSEYLHVLVMKDLILFCGLSLPGLGSRL
ncbi:uncharacterized protein ACR2FA_000707 [Aphomia sociella]